MWRRSLLRRRPPPRWLTNNIFRCRAIAWGPTLPAARATGGFIDYMNLINIRDGGVNGVKLTWDECETQYEVERGVECYERQKSHPQIAAWNPLSVGIAYASTASRRTRRR